MFDVDEPTLPEPDALSDREDEPDFNPDTAEGELATLSSHLDAATYRQPVLIRRLEESGHGRTLEPPGRRGSRGASA